MKVGIDTFGCESGKSGGGIYLNQILKSLCQIEPDFPVEFELFGLEAERYDYEAVFSEHADSRKGAGNVSFSFVSVNLPASRLGVRLWHEFGCNFFFRRQKYDAVLFFGTEFLPMRCAVPSVAVVNDVVSERLSSLNSFMRLKKVLSLRNVGRIVAPTQFVKKDLRSLRVDSDRIAVVHNGLDHSVFYPRGEVEGDVVNISPFAIQKPYFIYVSKMSGESKRHCELIRAFSDFKFRTKAPHRLVLAGEDGGYLPKVQAAVAESWCAQDIFITGYYPHENYPDLYAGAAGCVYPSVCEGVGMPVLEAMSMGVPLACARSGAIPEVAGEYAIYFDGNSTEEMSRAIENLASPELEGERKRRAEHATFWAAKFTWEKAAEDLLSELKAAASEKPPVNRRK